MKNLYRSAMGRAVDMESLRLANEEIIAVGNMRVNARGDELGPGGEITRTRNEVMNDYYKLSTPTVTHTQHEDVPDMESLMAPVRAQAQAPELRGNLANSVLKPAKKTHPDSEV